MQATSTLRHRDPLYRKIYTKLRETITSGGVPIGSLLPSELQLCERHKASRITVKHALDLLREEGLVRVIHGAGWQVIAPEPASSTSLGECLLIIPPRLEALVFTRSVEARLRSLGANVRTLSAERRPGNSVLETARALLNGPQPPRGMILYHDSRVSTEFTDLLRQRGVHAVFAGLQELGECSAAAMDNAAATGALTRLLIQRGHRHLLFVGSERLCTQIPTFQARMDGYRAVMRDRGFVPEVLLIDPNNLLFPSNERAFSDKLVRLESEGRRISAVVAQTGAMAQGVAMAFARRGRSLPRDCSLTCIGDGYDHEVMEGMGLQGVTCVEEPWEEIALASADALADLLKRPGARPRLTLIHGRLVDHGSAPPMR